MIWVNENIKAKKTKTRYNLSICTGGKPLWANYRIIKYLLLMLSKYSRLYLYIAVYRKICNNKTVSNKK